MERLAPDREDILDAYRHAEQWALGGGSAGGDGFVHRIGLGQGVRGIVAEKGVYVAVNALDLVEAGLGRFASGGFAPRQAGGQLGKGEPVQHGRRSEPYSTMYGTTNRPWALRGSS